MKHHTDNFLFLKLLTVSAENLNVSWYGWNDRLFSPLNVEIDLNKLVNWRVNTQQRHKEVHVDHD